MPQNRYTKPNFIEPSKPPLQTFTRSELYDKFHSPIRNTLNFFSSRTFVEESSEEEGDDEELPLSTLERTNEHPLNHLILLIVVNNKHFHPDWYIKKQLWVRVHNSQLEKRLNYDKKNYHRLLPLFWGGDGGKNGFRFFGWWKIVSLEIVEPYSKELAEMIRAKESAGAYGHDGRIEQQWDQPFSSPWAKIKMVQVKERFSKGISELQNGDGAEYVLKVGRLNEEVKVLRQFESGDWVVENGSR